VSAPRPQEFTLEGDAAYADGRQLTGNEIDALARSLEQVRLTTWWRELRRDYPVGCRVQWTTQQAEVIGHNYARPGQPAHRLRIRTRRGDEITVYASDVVRLRASEVE